MKALTTNYGEKNIGGMVRKIIKATMGNELQLQYNRSGMAGKRKFPEDFETCIYRK